MNKTLTYMTTCTNVALRARTVVTGHGSKTLECVGAVERIFLITPQNENRWCLPVASVCVTSVRRCTFHPYQNTWPWPGW